MRSGRQRSCHACGVKVGTKRCVFRAGSAMYRAYSTTAISCPVEDAQPNRSPPLTYIERHAGKPEADPIYPQHG
jgi:hypothetical protein